jgi:phosphoribosylanthranilate isomerase
VTFIKICGITNLNDALAAESLGTDALGFNFYNKSPRYIRPDSAAQITKHLSPRTILVGVFVNAEIDFLLECNVKCRLDYIQLHGDETGSEIERVKAIVQTPIIKAIRLNNENIKKNNLAIKHLCSQRDFILLDAFSENEYGGTGKTIDELLAESYLNSGYRVILAGGLNPQNISEKITRLKPFGVDTASGVEKSPGVKDYEKLKIFITRVRKLEQN